MAKNDKPVEKKGCVCIQPVKHGGVKHLIDDPIELTAEEARPLLACGAILDPEAVKAAAPAGGDAEGGEGGE